MKHLRGRLMSGTLIEKFESAATEWNSITANRWESSAD